MNCKKIILFINTIAFFTVQNVKSQDLLTLEEAVYQSLQNNYSIQLVKKQVAIAEKNNTIANAGFLPTINLDAKREAGYNHSVQERNDGTLRVIDWAPVSNMNAGAMVNWKIFKGFDVIINKNTLNELQHLEELEARLTIESTISSVLVNYYNLVVNKMRINVLQNAMSLSSERKRLIDYKYKVGAASKTDVFQATVDFNNDTSAYLNQLALVRTLKSDLNVLLGREPSIDYDIIDSLTIDKELDYGAVLQKVQEENTNLFIARKNIELSKLNVQYWKSQYYPQINLFTGYNYIYSQNPAGFAVENRSHAPTAGISGQLSLFNGSFVRRNEAIAKIQLESSKLQQEQTRLEITNTVFKLYQQYEVNLKLATLQYSNQNSAKMNLDIAIEKYKNGVIGNIELRDIQMKYINAQDSYLQAVYDVKALEAELLRLTGELAGL